MLEAALAVFGEKGFEGATLDEVAERAEFGKGTLYNYFPGGKDELYLALFDEYVVTGMETVIAEAFEDPDEVTTVEGARRSFRRMIAGLIDHFETNRSVLLLFLREGHRLGTDPAVVIRFAERFERVFHGVAVQVERATAAGTLRDLPARPVAHLLMGNVRGYLMANLMAGADCPAGGSLAPLPDPDEAADFITTVLFDGLLADPDRPAAGRA